MYKIGSVLIKNFNHKRKPSYQQLTAHERQMLANESPVKVSHMTREQIKAIYG